MKILALDRNGNKISVDDFFAVYDEFSTNYQLMDQTNRFLGVIMRNSDAPEILATRVEKNYVFTVDGEGRRYNILFEIWNDFIILKEVN